MPTTWCRKLDQLAGHYVLKTVNASDAIADADYRACFGNIDRRIVIFNFRAKYTGDFVCSDLSHIFLMNFP